MSTTASSEAAYPLAGTPCSSSITVDGLVLPLDDWACAGGGCSVYTHANNLADGPHAIEMVFVDWAGNRGVLDSSLVVDTTGPVLSQPSPTGTITTTTPALSVITTDGGSGVDPKGIAMTLSNGVVSSRLTPTYDPQNGRISYQVPTTVTGVGVGQSPLLDGTYTVTTSVRDRAGNVSSTSWRFTVKTLPL